MNAGRIVLLGRASVARRLVRKGLLDPELALSYVVWPTARIKDAEQQVSYSAMADRAYGRAAA